MGRPIKYSKEFKLSAVKLVTELGYSCREAGEQLGCSSWSVRDWGRQLRASRDIPPENVTAASAQDMKALREENARLRLENEILKKQRRTLPRSPCKVRTDQEPKPPYSSLAESQRSARWIL
jgi:transposase-like protein